MNSKAVCGLRNFDVAVVSFNDDDNDDDSSSNRYYLWNACVRPGFPIL